MIKMMAIRTDAFNSHCTVVNSVFLVIYKVEQKLFGCLFKEVVKCTSFKLI